MTLRRLLRAFPSIFVVLLAGGATASDRYPAWLAPCEDSNLGALCGTYDVWEDRAAQKGRRIGLYVVVLPATGPGPYEAPIFPIAGGPGQAASDAVDMSVMMFEPLRVTRDIVLLDQRGTGRSNKLDCGVPPPGTPLQAYFDDFPSESFARECLEKQKADVRLYTTDMAVGDLDEIRRALGYDRISLIGGSYGTRVALHYIRRHADRVRSAVLDGVSPPYSAYQAQFAPAFEKTLAYLFDRCASDPACSAAFPDLESDWTAALERFAGGPVETSVVHPETNEEERVTFSRGVFVDGIRRMLYGAGGWGRVAATIHAAAQGDFDPFAQSRFVWQSMILRELSLGMLLTIACSEGAALMDDAEVERVTAGTSLGDHRARTIRNACRGWRSGALPADWSTPVSADVPVLILSGAVDPATPPWVAAEVAEHLPNSLHVIVPNRTHGPTDFECEIAVVREFFRKASAEGLDTGCLEATAWPAFEPPATPGEAVAVDAERLATYVGSYELRPGFVLVVVLEDGHLFIKPPGESRHALRPESEDTFFVTGIGERLTFLRNAAGVVDRFQLENGPTAKKVE